MWELGKGKHLSVNVNQIKWTTPFFKNKYNIFFSLCLHIQVAAFIHFHFTKGNLEKIVTLNVTKLGPKWPLYSCHCTDCAALKFKDCVIKDARFDFQSADL